MNIIFDKMGKGELIENNYIDNKIIIGNIRKMKEIEKKVLEVNKYARI